MKKQEINALKEAQQAGQDLIQMYQAGFMDGFNNRRYAPATFQKIRDKCKKAFDKRFRQKIMKQVKKNGNNNRHRTKKRTRNNNIAKKGV